MRIFKTRAFDKWAKKAKVSDQSLLQAVHEIEQGLVDSNLGGHVHKKRIAGKGKGKRGGLRSILVYQTANKAFFVFGYAKNEKANISDEELHIAKAFATEVLGYSDAAIHTLILKGKLIEVKDNG